VDLEEALGDKQPPLPFNFWTLLMKITMSFGLSIAIYLHHSALPEICTSLRARVYIQAKQKVPVVQVCTIMSVQAG